MSTSSRIRPGLAVGLKYSPGMDDPDAPRTLSGRARLTAAVAGFGLTLAAWPVVLVASWSGLLFGMPREYGGAGWGLSGGYAAAVTVGILLTSLVLAVVHRSLRAGGIPHPARTTILGTVATAALCTGFLLLARSTFPNAPSVLLGVCPLLGSLTLAVLARWGARR